MMDGKGVEVWEARREKGKFVMRKKALYKKKEREREVCIFSF